ncbi:hypothetical protein FSP39_025167 [Pinctada imbricata]|uniref:Uncharacterized protein n=1 Tax=Pinctada imbricata TaxID=66713 RepID=A0AA88XDX1_PINIB|nr:hypothetical protein FSP39_025167 [Pinctada imbricata]
MRRFARDFQSQSGNQARVATKPEGQSSQSGNIARVATKPEGQSSLRGSQAKVKTKLNRSVRILDAVNINYLVYRMDLRLLTSLCMVVILWDQSALAQDSLSPVCVKDRMDLVFIIDASTSVGSDNFKLVIRFVEQIVKDLNIDNTDTRVGLLMYSTSTEIRFTLDQHNSKQKILEEIRAIRYNGGSTNTADALLAMRTKVFGTSGDRPDVKNVAIVITDGLSNINALRTVQEASDVHGAGITVYGVGIGLQDTRELDAIASSPTNTFRHNVQDFDQLDALKNQIFPSNCGVGSDSLDLIFLLHFSQQMTRYDFDLMVTFIENLLEGADVDADDVRVGIALYNMEGSVVFELNRYAQDKEALMRGIRTLSYSSRSDSANLAAGLSIVRLGMFQEFNGDRPDVPNALVVLTDANSNSNFVAGLPKSVQDIKQSGITIFSIGIGLRNQDEVNSLATKPEFSYVLRDMGQLSAVTKRMQTRLPALQAVLLPPEIPTPRPIVTEKITQTLPPLPVTTKKPVVSLEYSDEADILVIFHSGHKTKAKEFNKRLKVFISNLFAKANIDKGKVRGALINYGAGANVLFDFNKYSKKKDLRGYTRRLRAKLRSSKSNLLAALKAARTQVFTAAGGARTTQDVPGAVILITDMKANTPLPGIVSEVDELKKQGISFFTLGIGKADTAELQSISSQPVSEYYQKISKYDQLIKDPDVIDHIIRGIYSLQGASYKGQRRTTSKPIIVTKPPITTTTKPIIITKPTTVATTTAYKQPVTSPVQRDPKVADIVIVFHAYPTVTRRDFKKYLLKYMVRLVKKADIDGGKVRVAVVTYGGKGQVVLQLDQFSSKKKLLKGIKKIPKNLRFKKGNLQDALLKARRDVLGVKGRQNVNQYVILITDASYMRQMNQTSFEEDKLNAEGVTIYVVAVGVKDTSGLRYVASYPIILEVKEMKDLKNYKRTGKPIVRRISALRKKKKKKGKKGKKNRKGKKKGRKNKKGKNKGRNKKKNRGKKKKENVNKSETNSTIPNTTSKNTLVSTSIVRNVSKDQSNELTTLNVQTNPIFDPGNVKPAKSSINVADSFQVKNTSEIVVGTTDIIVHGDMAETKSTKGIDNTDRRGTEETRQLTRTPSEYQSKDKDDLITVSNQPDGEGEQTTSIPFTDEDNGDSIDGNSAIQSSTILPITNYFTLEDVTIKYDEGNVRPSLQVDYEFTIKAGESKTEDENMATTQSFQHATDTALTKGYGQTDGSDLYEAGSVADPLLGTEIKEKSKNLNKAETACGSLEADIAIALDASLRTNRAHFIEFADMLIQKLESAINSGSVRVSLNTFTDRLLPKFSFDTYTDTSEMLDSVRTLSFRGGRSNIATAISMITDLFGRGRGTRQNAPDIAIMVLGQSRRRQNINNIKRQAQRSRSRGIETFVLGIGDFNNPILQAIASKPILRHLFPIEMARVLTEMPEETVTHLCQESGAADIVFAIHSSSTADTMEFNMLLNFLVSLISRADINNGQVQTGLLVYNDAATPIFYFNQYKTSSQIRNAILNLSNRLRSDNVDAATAMRKSVEMFSSGYGARATVPKALFMITDAASTINVGDIEGTKASLKGMGIDVYSVGVGLRDKSELEAIATSSENIYSVSGYDKLNRAENEIRRNVRSSCFAKVDIVFVLDSSTSVGEQNFKKMLKFCKDFLHAANIDSGDVRVGIVSYSTSVTVEFQMNKFKTKSDIYDAIDKIPWRYGSTNTADALQTMHTDMFTTDNGDRADVRNIAIVVTDGVSNINSRRTIPEAERARAKGIQVYAIGIGLTDKREVNGIASVPAADNAFFVTNFDELEGLDEQIFQTFCPACNAKVDLIFVLDSSTSVGQDNFSKMLRFCKEFLHSANIDSGDVRVGVVTYSTDVTVEFQMNDYFTMQEVLDAIDNIPWRYGSTNTADGLLKMHDVMFTLANGDRPDVDNVAVVMTDGVSNINSRRTIPEADAAHMKNIHVYAIGIGLTDMREVNEIASEPHSENAFAVQTFDDLEGLDEQIFNSICPECFSKVDLVFILDSSTSVGEGNYKKMLQFCKDFLHAASIDTGDVRVGLVSYSTSVTVEFQMNEYSTKQQIYDAIDQIPWRYGSTNTADALQTMHEDMFTVGNGDRPDVKNLAIIVTDGVSNINSRRTIPEAEAARAKNIHIYAIGIGLTDVKEVNGIASIPAEDNAFFVQNFDELEGLDEDIFKSLCEACNAKVDLVFVLDSSTSVGQDNFVKMQTFCKEFLHSANIDSGDVRVGVVTYSTDVTVEFHMNEYSTRQAVFDAIDAIPWRYGSTNTADGLLKMHDVMFTAQNGDRPDVDNIALVMTDGVSNINSRRTIPEADAAHQKNIHVYAIGIGLTDMREVNEIASEPHSENAFAVKTFDDLEGLDEQIFNSICPECFAKIDMVFILDSSTSVGQANFKKMLQFCKDFLHSANIDSGEVRVGIVSYSTDVTVEFNMNEYSTREEIENAIDNIPWRYGSTNTADGLQTMHEQMFTVANGDRPDVDDIAIIVTDGVSNINSRRTIPEAENARAKNIHIYAIGIGLTDDREVNGIASDPPEKNAFFVNDFDELEGLDESIFSSICPAKPRDSGYDVVVVMDSSVPNEIFGWMKGFVRSITKSFNIDNEEYKVGLLRYSTNPDTQWQLSEYKKGSDVVKAVDNVPYLPGERNTAQAIDYVTSQMFRPPNGDRDFARNYIILLTGIAGSPDRYEAWLSAENAEKAGARLFTIGINLDDTTELDEISSHPLSTYQYLIDSEEDLKGIPDEMRSSLNGMPKQPGPWRPRPRRPPPECFAKIDMVFILDSSTSVGQDNYKKMLQFCKDFLHSANIDSGEVRVGIVSYSTEVTVEFQMNEYSTRQDIYNAIDNIPWRYGSTNTADGLQTMHEQMFTVANGDRPDVDDIAIIVTDGVSNINSRRTIPEAEAARAKNIHIYAIGIGLTDDREVNGIASDPPEKNAFFVNDFDELEGLDESIFSSICPAKPRDSGYDVVVVMDSSVPNEIFGWMKGFVRSITKSFNIDNEEYKVGLLRYSTNPDTQWQLSEYSKGSDVVRAVNNVPYLPGERNTAQAIDYVTSQMFRPPKGDRDFARNYIVLLTGISGSPDRYEAWIAAENAEKAGARLFTIGINLDDTTELDEISSHPLSTYQYLINNEEDLKGIPDEMSVSLSGMPKQPGPWRPRPRRPPPECFTKIDMVFILDSSTSVGQANFKKMLQFCKDFLHSANIDTGDVRVGIVSYSTDVTVEFHMNEYQTKQDIYNAIDNIPWRYGSTNTADGLQRMHEQMFTVANGDRSGVDDIAIIVTDGVSNINSRRTIPEAEAARAKNIHIYAIGIGLTDDREVNGIASDPPEKNAFFVNDFDELEGLDESIFSSICPAKPRDSGYDVVVVMDSSVPNEIFGWMKGFVRSITKSFNIDNEEYKVGLLRYSTNPDTQWQLSEYSKGSDVVRAVDNVPYLPGERNTAQAIDYVTSQMFRPPKGDRDFARNYIVLLTGISGSPDRYEAWIAAENAEKAGARLFTIGINLDDTTELDEISSHPLSTYQYLINSEEDLKGIPDEMSVSLSGKCFTKIDMVFILDSSTSVGQENYKKMLQFCKDFLHSANIDSGDVRVGIVSYSTDVTVEFQMNDYTTKQDIYNAIDNIPWRYGSTNTADGLQTMHEQMFTVANGDRPDVDDIAIIVTDGVSNINSRRTIPEAENARAKNIHIYAIGIGLTDDREVNGIASDPPEKNAFFVNDFDELEGLDETACGLAKVDLVIILDSSTSVGQDNFNKMLEFCKEFLANSDIDSGSVRVGILSYSTAVHIHFYLDSFSNTNDMFNAIDTIPWNYGSTNTADGLKTMRNQLFTSSRGDRPDVKNVAIIITDGVSNINARDTIPQAEAARNDGIHVYAIGIGLSDRTELDAIASVPASENSFAVQSFDELKGLDKKIFQSICPAKPPLDLGYDVVIVMDSSVPNRQFGWMKDFVRNIAQSFSIDDEEFKVGLLRYSTNPSVQWQLNEYDRKNDVIRAVDRVSRRRGRRNTAQAIDYVKNEMFRRRNGDRDIARNFIILLTGQDESPDRYRAWQSAENAEVDGIRLFTVGINLRDTTEIDEISSHPLSTYRYLINRESDLRRVPDQMRDALRRTTTTTAAPLDSGYDVVIVMDSSVPRDTFDWMKGFVRSISESFSIDNEEYKVGVLRYSSYPEVQWNLREYSTKNDIIRAVNRIGYRPGRTNTAQALEYVKNSMFRRSAGDRDFARDFIILLTGQDDSTDKYRAWAAAEKAENEGIRVFTVGINLNDTSEIDEISSHPLTTYRYLVRKQSDLLAVPGIMKLSLNDMPERPEPARPRPVRPTTPPPPTTTRKPGKCNSSGDIVFILDSSGSVGRDQFYKVLNFTYTTVSDLDIDTGHFRIAVITFSDNARLEFNLNRYTTRAEVEGALQRVSYVYGSTHTAEALRMAREQVFTGSGGDRPDVPNVVIIVTDGESNINNEQTIPEARQLKSTGVTMITVAVGFAQRTTELIGLTSKPINDNLVRVENYDALHNLKDKLVAPLCSDENQCRNNPCQNGGFCLDGLGSYQCVCVNGHYGDNCEKKCGDAADVVFVLDSSTTVGRETFERMRRYTSYLIREMDAEECNIRIGVLKYSSAPMVQFQIGTYTDTDTMVYAVDNIGYTRGRANMAAAFRSLRTRMFNGGGDRPGVRNIAYLLTDGSADVNAENTLREAELAMEADIRIIPIGVEMRQRDEVNNIAFSQGISTIEIMNDEDDANIRGLRDQILSPVFDNVDYCAGDPCENGGKCKVANGGYTCECVPGYTGDNCNRRCNARGDVVFVVDTSRYVGRKELRYIKRFMRSIVRRMAFKRNRFRVGVVQFSNTARVALTLADGSRKKSTNSGIYGLRKYGGNPIPAQGLQKARMRVLGSKSDRSRVADYVVFITKSMRKENDIISEASKMKMAGIHVIGIGIELSGSDQDFLSYAVSSPLPSYLHVTPDVSGLDAISDNLMSFFCNDHNACASNPCENGGECVNMQNGAYECRCRRGFSGRNCQQACGGKADLIFLLDSSGSVGRKHFRNIKQFVYSIVDQLTIGPDDTRVAVATYSSKARMGFNLDQYYSKQKIQNAISAMEYRYGNTNTAGGLKMVRRNILSSQRGDRPNVPNILVVVTDGVSNVNPENTIPQAGFIKDSGTHIFAIGVGGFQPDELNAIASEPAADNAFLVSDYSDLFTLSDTIVSGTCKDESVCSTNPCRNGGTCIAEINGFSCKCPRGFNGPYCGNECASEKDIVFVLDSSSSVGEKNFNSMLDFVQALLEELSSGNNRNKFAMVTYSTDVNLIFSFSRYSDTSSLTSAVSTVRYTPGSTNTAGGLRSAFELLQGNYGSRRSAEDIVVLLTDGQSNVNSYDTVPAAETLKASGAHIIGIGIGLSDATELNNVVSGTDDVFQASSFETLKTVKADIVSNTCARG